MSDEPTSNAPDNQPTEPTGQASTPPWGDDFDPERAWRLIENLRGDNAKAKERLSKFEEEQRKREEAEKSELQKAIERAERAEKALAEREAERERDKALKAALKAHGLSEEDAELLDGVPADKLEARAEALAKRLGKSNPDTTEDAIPGKPKPRLAPGHRSAADIGPRFDANAIAERIRNNLY